MVFGFRRKSFLDADDELWHLDMWRWMLTHFGGLEYLKQRPLVRPIASFFPSTEKTGHQRAEHVFVTVKDLAGLAGWPCELLAQPERPDLSVGDLAVLKMHKHAPLGTFSASGNNAVISYDPKSIANPAELVSTFAHELAHYMIATVAVEPPGGEEMHEFAADLMTIHMGFGVFGANRAFNFSQHQDFQRQGWQWSRQGYLRERDWMFSLAVFAALRGEAVSTMRTDLKPYLYTDLVKAVRYLSSKPELLAL